MMPSPPDLSTLDCRKRVIKPDLTKNLAAVYDKHQMTTGEGPPEEWRFVDASDYPDYPDPYQDGNGALCRAR